MKLGQKNLVYSMVLAGIMLAFLAGYFSYMLPSLYVDYCMEQNLKSIREQHAAYMDTGTYDGIQVKNGTACYSVEIPLEGNYLRVTGKAFSVEVELREERLVHILQRLREILQADWAGGVQLERDSLEKTKKTDTLGQMQEELAEVFRELYGETEGGPFQIRLLYSRSMEEAYFNETMRYHTYSDNMVILEAGVEDGENKYTNYMAVQMTKDRIVLSFLPVVTPDMEEIKPIVWQSLPMLGAVVVLVVLLFSRVYSRGIVAPIVELSNHAEQMKYARDFSVERLESKRKEKQGEIRELADTLDDFYDRIREGYGQLQAKNAQLQAENEREEVFLRTSAHQLKTPIAAALLLADGMIHGVGKYQDVKTYLPKVKEQLLSMRKMTEDILYLNRCVKEMEMQMLSPGKLLQEKLRLLEPVLAQKHLRLEYGQGEEDAGEEGTGRRDGKRGRSVRMRGCSHRLWTACCQMPWPTRRKGSGSAYGSAGMAAGSGSRIMAPGSRRHCCPAFLNLLWRAARSRDPGEPGDMVWVSILPPILPRNWESPCLLQTGRRRQKGTGTMRTGPERAEEAGPGPWKTGPGRPVKTAWWHSLSLVRQ